MNKKPFREQIALQSWLRPELTVVLRNGEYDRFKSTLDEISGLLRSTGIEEQAVDLALENFADKTARGQRRRKEFAIQALRVETLRQLLGMPSYRDLSRQLSSSDLLADFCGLLRIAGIVRTSKSTLERMSKLFGEEQLRQLHQTLSEACGNADLAVEIGLEEPLDMGVCLIDGTCLDANIHYPVDWVLLSDVSQTLLKATKLIRAEQILWRMPQEPDAFAREMNRLCIEMTHSRRKLHAKKQRKKVLRRMKKLLRTIGEHALRHGQLLEQHWEDSRFSQPQAMRIVERIGQYHGQIDEVIRQAHERIIGQRPIDSNEKILSVHERDVNVIVRGKAGREVEFGNHLTLCENESGYIVDWKLYADTAPSEQQQMKESLERMSKWDLNGDVRELCGDRGFNSKAGSKFLQKNAIADMTCPRNPQELSQRMEEVRFAQLQKRRAGTEARIATLLNRWLGCRLRAKGYRNRAQAVAWGVLGHNLWLIARQLAQLEARRCRTAA